MHSGRSRGGVPQRCQTRTRPRGERDFSTARSNQSLLGDNRVSTADLFETQKLQRRAEAEVKRTARLTSVAVKRISVDSIERAAAEVQKMTSSRLYTIQERKLQK